MPAAVYQLQTGQQASHDAAGNVIPGQFEPQYQTSYIDNPDMNQSAIQNLINQGYSFQGYQGPGGQITEGEDPYHPQGQGWQGTPSGAPASGPGSAGWSTSPQNYNSPYYDPFQNPLVQQSFASINAMKAQMDAMSKRQMDLIHQQYSQFIDNQKEFNRSTEAARNQSLLMGGSSRYAQLSSEGIMHAQVSFGLGEIAKLQTQENQALFAAQQAADNMNFQLMEKQMSLTEALRQEKQNSMKEYNDKLIAENEKIQAAKKQQANESAIGSIIAETGSNDPLEIFAKLQEKGINIGAKEINETIANFSPNVKAVTDIMADLKRKGAPDSITRAVGQSRTVADALNAAGGWMQDALNQTGVLGAFARHKQEMESAGYVAESFDSFNDEYEKKQSDKEIAKLVAQQKALLPGEIDKAKIIAGVDLANAKAKMILEGKLNADGSQITTNVTGFSQSPEIQKKIDEQNALDWQTTYSAYQTIDSITKKYGKSPSNFSKEDASKLSNQEAVSLSKALARIQLPDVARSGGDPESSLDPTSLIGKGFAIGRGLVTGKKYLPGEISEALKAADTIYQGKLKGMMGGNESQVIVENQAKSKLQSYISSHPGKSSEIDTKRKSMEQILGRSINPSEFLQQFPQYQ